MNINDGNFLTYNTLYIMYFYTLTEELEKEILKKKSHTKKSFDEFHNKILETFKYDFLSKKIDCWFNFFEISKEKRKFAIQSIKTLLDILNQYKNKDFFQEIEDELFSKDNIGYEKIISNLLKNLNENFDIKKILITDYSQKYYSIENFIRDKMIQYIDKLINIYFSIFRTFLTYFTDKKFNKDYKLQLMYASDDYIECSEKCLFAREQSKSEILRLQNILEIKNDELIEMENKIKMIKEENEEKENEILNLKKEIENNLLFIKMKEQKLKENESDIKYKDDCIKDMESRLKSQKNNNKSDKNKLKNTIKDLITEKEELIKKIAHYGEININLKNELTFHQKTIDIQKNEIQGYKDKIDDLNKKIYDLNQDNYKLDVQIMEYENYLKIVS